MVEDIDDDALRERDPTKLLPPLTGALLKNEQDVHLFERLAFLARREGSERPGRARTRGGLTANSLDRKGGWFHSHLNWRETFTMRSRTISSLSRRRNAGARGLSSTLIGSSIVATRRSKR